MEQKRDKNLDTPSEANTEKHLNFLEAEERAVGSNNNSDQTGHTKADENRRREWERGLEEGRKEAGENNTV